MAKPYNYALHGFEFGLCSCDGILLAFPITEGHPSGVYSLFHRLWALILAFRDWHLHVVVRSRTREGEGVVVFGNPILRHHMTRIYLDPIPTNNRFIVRARTEHWRLNRADIRDILRRRVREFGLVAGPEGRMPELPDMPSLRIPQFVKQVIDLPPERAEYEFRLSKSRRRDLRGVLDQGFTCQISEDPAAWEAFRRHYLRPTVVRRHGLEAHVIGRKNFHALRQDPSCELVQVWQRGTWVGGAVNRRQTDDIVSLLLGWMEGANELLRSGVVTSLYGFLLDCAYADGIGQIDLGVSAPYLEDGVFQFKTRWQARLCPPSPKVQRLVWYFDPTHPRLRRFFQRYSVVAMDAQDRLVVFTGRPLGWLSKYPALQQSLTAIYSLRTDPQPARTECEPGASSSWAAWFDQT